jgi:hypothetical protein
MRWFLAILDDVRRQAAHAWGLLRRAVTPAATHAGRLHQLSGMISLLLVGGALVLVSRAPARLYIPPPDEWEGFSVVPEPEPPPDLTRPVREIPNRFPPRMRMPTQREVDSATPIDGAPFDPDRDLVYVMDDRVYWESDHDVGDTEDDHLVHFAVEEPLRRLIELVDQAGGTLEVHDAYRDVGVHHVRSLHRQGRAVDLTCDDLGLEELGKLTWAAGFDWVLYEVGPGGHHIHASVRPDRKRLAAR